MSVDVDVSVDLDGDGAVAQRQSLVVIARSSARLDKPASAFVVGACAKASLMPLARSAIVRPALLAVAVAVKVHVKVNAHVHDETSLVLALRSTLKTRRST